MQSDFGRTSFLFYTKQQFYMLKKHALNSLNVYNKCILTQMRTLYALYYLLRWQLIAFTQSSDRLRA